MPFRHATPLVLAAALAWGAAPDARAEKGPGDAELIPGSNALALKLGVMANVFGGRALPRIDIDGDSDNDFHGHAHGAGFALLLDTPAMGLDWRFGLMGGLPSYFSASATAGVRRNLSASRAYRLMTRVGVGLEGMFAGEGPANFFLPVLLGEGEVAALWDLGGEAFAIGPAVDVSARYGIPFGVGLGAGAFLRVEGRW